MSDVRINQQTQDAAEQRYLDVARRRPPHCLIIVHDLVWNIVDANSSARHFFNLPDNLEDPQQNVLELIVSSTDMTDSTKLIASRYYVAMKEMFSQQGHPLNSLYTKLEQPVFSEAIEQLFKLASNSPWPENLPITVSGLESGFVACYPTYRRSEFPSIDLQFASVERLLWQHSNNSETAYFESVQVPVDDITHNRMVLAYLTNVWSGETPENYPPATTSDVRRALAEHFPAWELDEQGRIISANSLAVWLWGFNSLEEIQGMTVFEVFSRNMSRILEQDNTEMVAKKFAVLKKMRETSTLEWLPAYDEFINKFNNANKLNNLYELTAQMSDMHWDFVREWEYPLMIRHPLPAVSDAFLLFEVRVSKTDKGFVTTFRPSGETYDIMPYRLRNETEGGETSQDKLDDAMVERDVITGHDVKRVNDHSRGTGLRGLGNESMQERTRKRVGLRFDNEASFKQTLMLIDTLAAEGPIEYHPVGREGEPGAIMPKWAYQKLRPLLEEYGVQYTTVGVVPISRLPSDQQARIRGLKAK